MPSVLRIGIADRCHAAGRAVALGADGAEEALGAVLATRGWSWMLGPRSSGFEAGGETAGTLRDRAGPLRSSPFGGGCESVGALCDEEGALKSSPLDE